MQFRRNNWKIAQTGFLIKFTIFAKDFVQNVHYPFLQPPATTLPSGPERVVVYVCVEGKFTQDSAESVLT